MSQRPTTGVRVSPGMVTALVELALVVVMATAVGLSFSRVFGGAGLLALALWPALAAVALSAGTTGVGRWSPSGSALVSLGAGLVVVTLVTWGSPAELTDAATAVVRAWEQILRAPLPVPDRPELLVVVAVSSWFVAYAAAELSLRRTAPLLPLAPVVLAVALPLVLGAKGEPPSNAVLGALTLSAVAFVLVRTAGDHSLVVRPRAADGEDGPRHVRLSAEAARRPGLHPPGPGFPTTTSAARRLRRRRLVAALPVVVAAGVLPVVLGDHLPLSGDARFDSRDEQLGEPPEMLSPLAEVSAQRNDSETRDLFVATAPEGIELWRLAVFDQFDGATWDSSATFVPAGRELPQSTAAADESGDDAGADVDAADDSGSTSTEPEVGVHARQEITLQQWGSAYLPVAGRALELDGPDIRFDPAGSTVLAESPVGEGTTYSVESVVVDPTDAQLDVARRDRSGADAVAARQPIEEAGVLADAAIDIATQRSASQTGSADVRQLRALQDFFADQSRFRLATEPVSGLSLRHLTAFVSAALQGGPAEGSVEQFAAAFATMARTLGYPTRVVVGYRTVERDGDGRYRVTNRDAFAWAEVKLEGLGWVEFPALPTRDDQTPPPTEAPTSTTSTTLADQGDTTPTTEAAGGGTGSDDRSGSGGMPLWQRSLLLVGALVVLAAVVAPLLRWQRRWRRGRDPDVKRRIDGAWRELLDCLAALRVPVTRSMTATEVVTVTSHHLHAALPADAHELTWLVNLARFGPTEQPPAAATAAWHRADAVLTWTRHHLSTRTRLRAWLDPRTTRPHSR